MLDIVIFYRRAFIHLQLSDFNNRFCPSHEEWERIEKNSMFFALFYEVTSLFFGTKYLTANLFFPQVFIIQHSLKEAINRSDSFMRMMAVMINIKFEKYWAEYSVVLAIAVMLDPRFKIQFVEWAYGRLYGNDSDEFRRVYDVVFDMFEVYSVKMSHLVSTSNIPSNSHSTTIDRDDSLF
ncbi:hypothetical protein LguiA_029022 [Lonicera macranthoides]